MCMHLCKRCNIELVPEINWNQSRIKHHDNICKICYINEYKEYYTKYREQFREKSRAYSKMYHRQNKKQVISHYSNGTMLCFCCGEKHIEFLTIDHINGGGTMHRKELRKAGISLGTGFYRWLIKQNYPDGYRVLCFNCNQARGLYGQCPHEE
jgi:hypothetical protein